MRKGAVLITGAGKRIGREIALSLGRDGYAVAVHYGKSKDEAESVAREIENAGGIAATVQAELADYQKTKDLVAAAAKKIDQPVTVLINNAALFMDNTVSDFSNEDWDATFNANLKAPAVLSQSFAREMPKGKKGVIINMIDQRVLGLDAKYLTYTISKHALWSLTKILAVELAPNIRVNGIAPGPTLASIFQNKKDFEKEAASTLLGQGPELHEITSAIKFLLETPSITGQMITLDGGQHLQ